MSDTSDAALHLLTLLGDDTKLKAKLDEFIKRKTAAEHAEQKMLAAKKDHDENKEAADRYVNERKGVLNEAQIAHDRAAKEAAGRIELGNKQAAALDERKAELDRRESELERNEANVAARERELSRLQAEIMARHSELINSQKELDDKHEKLKAAMG